MVNQSFNTVMVFSFQMEMEMSVSSSKQNHEDVLDSGWPTLGNAHLYSATSSVVLGYCSNEAFSWHGCDTRTTILVNYLSHSKEFCACHLLCNIDCEFVHVVHVYTCTQALSLSTRCLIPQSRSRGSVLSAWQHAPATACTWYL